MVRPTMDGEHQMKVYVTHYTLGLLHECAAFGGVQSTATQCADGRWAIELEATTFEALQAQQLPGESHDDAISRICRNHLGREAN